MKKLIVIFQLLMLVLVVPAQAQNQKKDFRKDFEAFKKKAKKEYADFRKNRLLLSTPSLFARLGRSLAQSLPLPFLRKKR